jgi:hypothetical protein
MAGRDHQQQAVLVADVVVERRLAHAAGGGQFLHGGGGVAVYAAWCPYAEYYLVRHNFGQDLEAFYGRAVLPQLLQRLDQLGIPYNKNAHFRFTGRKNDKNYGKVLNGRTSANSGIITSF